MDIIVLSGDNCPKCDLLKNHLDLQGKKYSVVNVYSSEGMKIVKEQGFKGIPQVLIEGGVVPRGSYLEVLGVHID